MIQYIIVALIGIVVLGIVVRHLYGIFTKPKGATACGGCKACPQHKIGSGL